MVEKDVFYSFTGVYGHNIEVLAINGLDFFEAFLSSANNPSNINKSLVEKRVLVNGQLVTREMMVELSALDVAEFMEIINRQFTKLIF